MVAFHKWFGFSGVLLYSSTMIWLKISMERLMVN